MKLYFIQSSTVWVDREARLVGGSMQGVRIILLSLCQPILIKSVCALSLTRKQTHHHTHADTHLQINWYWPHSQDSHLPPPSPSISLSFTVSLCFHLSILKYQEVYEPLKSKLYYPLLDLLDMLVLGNLFSLVLPLSVYLSPTSHPLHQWGAH